MFVKVDYKSLTYNMADELANHWPLLSAKKDNKVNTMTIGWGAMGVLWGKDAYTVYVRQSRYTKEFLDNSEYFTVSLMDDHKKELGYLGKVSGKDEDKIAAVHFDVEMVEDQPTFSQAKAVIICKKIYQDDIKIEDMSQDVVERYYSGSDEGNFHTMYIGEVVGCYINQ